MAQLDQLPLTLRFFLRAYRWRRVEPLHAAPLARPLSKCRVALVTSAGFVAPGQAPFDPGIAGGDFSFRVLPSEIDTGVLVESHRSRSFDHSGIRRDPNLAFPLDRLRELAREGRIGEVAPRHISFMGSITAPGRLMRDSAPAVADQLVGDAVDVALLVPV